MRYPEYERVTTPEVGEEAREFPEGLWDEEPELEPEVAQTWGEKKRYWTDDELATAKDDRLDDMYLSMVRNARK